MGLLMVGNGVQGTLLGIRGNIEGFATWELSVVMSAYFVGFLGGSRLAPELIRRVGHVRVFAALASLISAIIIVFPALADPWVWAILRVLIGFCFSGVYVTAESWLNNAATNDTRGQALSLYMIVQMAGIVLAQGILVLADPGGFLLFIIPSVLVSVSFAPILLSVSPTPAFETAKPMALRELYRISPLGVVGMVLMGGIFSALFGMAAIYAASVGLSVAQISAFMAAIYLGGLVLQYPMGWFSDRMDRRRLILMVGVIGGLSAIVGMMFPLNFATLLAVAFVIGGVSNPLYSLLIAYTNDYLEVEDMAAASGGLIFVNGLGAIAGPLVAGWLMEVVGPEGFWIMLAGLLLSVAGYALYRMTQRPAPSSDETGAYVSVTPSASPVAVEVAQEVAIEAAEEAIAES